jgi:hypothetical protein
MFGVDHLTRLVQQMTTRLEVVIATTNARFDALEKQLMANQQDLDASLDALGTAMDTGIASILQAVQDIAGRVGPSVDLSAEVARVQKAASDIANAASSVQGLDVAPVPPTPPTP